MFRICTISAAAIALLGSQVQAATPAQAAMAVNVTLTSSCSVVAPAAMVFNYTSGGAAISATGGTGGTVRCTEGLPFTMFLSKASILEAATTATVTYLDGTVGLTYSLTLNSAASPGTGSAQSYGLSGSMLTQWGACGTATCVVQNSRTIFLNF